MSRSEFQDSNTPRPQAADEHDQEIRKEGAWENDGRILCCGGWWGWFWKRGGCVEKKQHHCRNTCRAEGKDHRRSMQRREWARGLRLQPNAPGVGAQGARAERTSTRAPSSWARPPCRTKVHWAGCPLNWDHTEKSHTVPAWCYPCRQLRPPVCPRSSPVGQRASREAESQAKLPRRRITVKVRTANLTCREPRATPMCSFRPTCDQDIGGRARGSSYQMCTIVPGIAVAMDGVQCWSPPPRGNVPLPKRAGDACGNVPNLNSRPRGAWARLLLSPARNEGHTALAVGCRRASENDPATMIP